MSRLQALPILDQAENPFVGLRPFDTKEAIRFFGRGDQTAELLSRINNPRFLSVVGSSGCGKSSLIRAGMIPKLRAGLLVDNRDRWLVASMNPGSQPRKNLATALLQTLPGSTQPSVAENFAQHIHEYGVTALVEALGKPLERENANLLLLVDQFEEIFRFGVNTRQPQRRAEAQDFVSLMLALADQRESSVYVVMTMRSDFLGDCDAFPGLPEAMNRSQYLVPRLNRRQLIAAIEGPVHLGGKSIAPRLVDRLLNDLGDSTDELPALQHVLMRVWEAADAIGSSELDLEHYQTIGTLKNALSLHAEKALIGLDDDQVQRVFRALTHTDESNRRIRRAITVKQLLAETEIPRNDLNAIVDAFRRHDRSFLMPPETVELQDTSVV